MSIVLTEKAISEIKRIIAEQGANADKVFLRLAVRGGGCSGYQHKLELDEVWNEEKDNIEVYSEVKVVVDKRSALYCDGATIDFHEDLNKRGFVVSNPNSKSTCGCGSSFSM